MYHGFGIKYKTLIFVFLMAKWLVCRFLTHYCWCFHDYHKSFFAILTKLDLDVRQLDKITWNYSRIYNNNAEFIKENHIKMDIQEWIYNECKNWFETLLQKLWDLKWALNTGGVQVVMYNTLQVYLQDHVTFLQVK